MDLLLVAFAPARSHGNVHASCCAPRAPTLTPSLVPPAAFGLHSPAALRTAPSAFGACRLRGRCTLSTACRERGLFRSLHNGIRPRLWECAQRIFVAACTGHTGWSVRNVCFQQAAGGALASTQCGHATLAHVPYAWHLGPCSVWHPRHAAYDTPAMQHMAPPPCSAHSQGTSAPPQMTAARQAHMHQSMQPTCTRACIHHAPEHATDTGSQAAARPALTDGQDDRRWPPRVGMHR